MHSKNFHTREIPSILFFSFIITFFLARGVVYIIHNNLVPPPFFFIREIFIRGIHVHHFVFGILLIILAGFISLVSLHRSNIQKVSALYGIGLALIMDEFGMLVTLTDTYWGDSLNYGAVAVVGFLLFNACFFSKLKKIFTLAAKHG